MESQRRMSEREVQNSMLTLPSFPRTREPTKWLAARQSTSLHMELCTSLMSDSGSTRTLVLVDVAISYESRIDHMYTAES